MNVEGSSSKLSLFHNCPQNIKTVSTLVVKAGRMCVSIVHHGHGMWNKRHKHYCYTVTRYNHTHTHTHTHASSVLSSIVYTTLFGNYYIQPASRRGRELILTNETKASS